MKSVSLLGLAVALAVTLTGCSDSDKDRALGLARQVCGDTTSAPTTEPSANPLESTTDVQNLTDALPQFEEAANRAAQAARLDGTWNALAKAMDQYAELAETTAELGKLYRDQRAGLETTESSARVAELEQQRARQLQDDPSSAARAECRKTTTS